MSASRVPTVAHSGQKPDRCTSLVRETLTHDMPQRGGPRPPRTECELTRVCSVPAAPKEDNYTCHSLQFACGDGRCVKLTYVCDGDRDCADGRDETICDRLPANFQVNMSPSPVFHPACQPSPDSFTWLRLGEERLSIE